MTRRENREHLFCMLFQKDFHEISELSEQNDMYLAQIEDLKEKDEDYLIKKYNHIIEKSEEIDAVIEEKASGWKLNRMGKVEVTILRLAVYEIKYDEDIPVSVAINEAVELAKKFGDDNSSSFVNGVLAKIANA